MLSTRFSKLLVYIILVPSNENTKKKKEKKQFTSIRKYYGDSEDDVYIMDAKGTGNIGRYLNVSVLKLNIILI